jgi:hypothetical protein
MYGDLLRNVKRLARSQNKLLFFQMLVLLFKGGPTFLALKNGRFPTWVRSTCTTEGRKKQHLFNLQVAQGRQPHFLPKMINLQTSNLEAKNFCNSICTLSVNVFD